MARQYGNVVSLSLGPQSAYLISHPDYIKYVLQDNKHNYRKSRYNQKMKLAIGEGLLTSEGDIWRRQRRLAQPAFHRQRLAALTTVMTAVIAEMLERWQPVAERDQSLDIAAEMIRLTQRLVVKTLFGTDLHDEAVMLAHAVTIVNEHLIQRMLAFIDLPQYLPTLRNYRFRHALRTLDQVVYRIIDEHRHSGKDTGDLLSMLLHAQDEETGKGMSDRQLRDEVITLFLAGHETTANALAWTWYLLSQHLDVERVLQAELAMVLGGRTPTFQDLSSLTYTRMVVEEAVRLYPPVWVLSRTAVEDDEIGSYYTPANSVILMSPYVMHRHPDFWEKPEKFDPERFTPERSAGRPRYAYFPFGGGPRLCIGESFAMMEAQLIVAMVVQTYRLHLVPGHRVEPQPLLTLRPRHGILMTLQQHPVLPWSK